MTTIGDNARLGDSARKFLAKQSAKPAQAPTPTVDAKPEPTQATRRTRAYHDAVRRLRESVMSTTRHGKPVIPWTEERLSAAINRLHSFFFGTVRPEIADKDDEEAARFRFVLSCIFMKAEGLPGQSAEWYPDTLARAKGILEQRSKARTSSPSADKKVGASRVTNDGSVLQAV